MDIKAVTERKNKLTEVSNLLKEKFIGIDDVIDRVIDSISLWYIMPELQLRPPIVSLWGITGIGKTDLIRTLVKHLDFNDKFVEIQMDDIDKYYNNTIEDHLENGGIEPGEQAVLLLDEIQRYRTVDETGKMVKNKAYNDLWTLLSDGKFQNDVKRKYDLLELFYDELYHKDREENGDQPDEELKATNETSEPDKSVDDSNKKKTSQLTYQLSFWSAKRLKKILNVSTPVNDLMKLKTEEKIELIKSTLNDNDINIGKNYNKLLIIVSGNLDEAFEMSSDVSDVDSDADIYHKYSKEINIINIKDALIRKFKPEQIARFGNNHIIYPLLSKQNYKDIILKYSDEILDLVKTKHKIKVKLTQKVYEIIYNNGVFPTQGVRPTISTIYSILGNNIPYFLYYAKTNDITSIVIDYNKKTTTLQCSINSNMYEKDVILDIDNIKKKKSADEKRLIMVHELGHALVYTNLFKAPPKQINIDATGFSKGFIITHHGIDNKTDIMNRIATLLGGTVAEEIVFGEDRKTSGNYADIVAATTLAAAYVRKFNMGGTVSHIDREALIVDGMSFNHDIEESNSIIENLLTEQKKKASTIINENIVVLKELIKYAIDNKNKISVDKFTEICNKHKLNITKSSNTDIIYEYEEALNKFLNL